MTKNEIVTVIRRYCYITDAIEQGLSKAVFYKGHRKNVIIITEQVKTVVDIIAIVYKQEYGSEINYLIKLILDGNSDKYIINEIHYERNAYYSRKNAFIQKVYACCISRNLVSFDEILKEKIA